MNKSEIEFAAEQAERMDDLISRSALLAEYDRVHVGPPGGARQLIAEAPAAQRWIPVTERMSQEKYGLCKNVILLMDDGLVTVGWLDDGLVTVGWLSEGWNSGYYLPPRNGFIFKVPLSRFTHWMPLPEPPEEV